MHLKLATDVAYLTGDCNRRSSASVINTNRHHCVTSHGPCCQ